MIPRRYLRGSVIRTTNRGIAAWGTIFEDTTAAVAVLDRPCTTRPWCKSTATATACAATAPKLAQLRAGLNTPTQQD